MNKNIEKYLGKKNLTIVETLKLIDNGAKGVLYIIDDDKRLIGSITDGDIRRYLIRSGNINATIENIFNINPKYVFEHEINLANQKFTKYKITSLPVLDSNRKIVDIILYNDDLNNKFTNKGDLSNVPIIIMAGGKGTRLYPYTKILPKPLIPIGDIPILIRILNKFKEYNINEFYITVNYMKGMIKSYFNEKCEDYNIHFIEENEPLGTAGSISLIKKIFDCPVIVTNCDILINVNYAELYKYHLHSKNDITIVSSIKNIVVPYGVLEIGKDGIVNSMKEKPVISNLVNTGMYIVNPKSLEKIPNGKVFHMTDLVSLVMKENGKVGAYPISEDSFLDMGEFTEMKRMENKLGLFSMKGDE